MNLDDPVRFVKGVGPRRAELLEKAGIKQVEDLLYHLPFRYEDRRAVAKAGAAKPGHDGTFVGRISGVREHRMRGRKGRSLLRALFEDDSGWINLLWFHQASYFKEKLEAGERWLIHGRVEAASRGGLQIVHPEIEAVPAGQDGQAQARVLPVYQKPGDIPVAAIRSMVETAVEACASQARSVVPSEISSRLDLQPVSTALRFVHQPSPDVSIEDLAACRTPAQRSLIFEELFALQVGMTLRKAAREHRSGIVMAEARGRIGAFLSRLPFEPTGAQRRVIEEVSADMAAPHPMNRLVHGDVGSGKTVVAFAAALQAIEAGYQVAVMAPTELLAEQHFTTMSDWAADEGIDTVLLSGSRSTAAMREVRESVACGYARLVIGTHALVQESTEFRNLGLAIVDEQHRFGVMQRAALKQGEVDTLLLSATPIPRTLSLTLYGDIDVSFLDELPAGRIPVTTKVVRPSARGRLHERMANALAQGRQCYIVYPLVEESEKIDLADATSMAAGLQRGVFSSFKVGLLHGRMKPAEKDDVMRRFKAKEIDVLVATTVIEVGIDVPNASIMVVEHAERFGLAQLHQLRGRVGRGSQESFCCLVAEAGQSREAFERLRVLERSNDGFEVAEADLKLRGPGEYLGTRQSGLPAFRAANLVRDSELLELARREALAWLQRDASLSSPQSAELRRTIAQRWSEKLDLAEVG